MRSTIACGVNSEQLARTRPARPLTWGAAMDEPDFWTKPPPGALDRIPVPGAATSTQVPKLEFGALLSSAIVLATESTFGHEPGHCLKLSPLLPAVATSTVPRLHA